MTTTLARLPVAVPAVLRTVGGARSYRRRLLELGFVPGTTLRLVRRVGIGDVLEVELRGSRVSLRISEAEVLQVEAADLACCPTAEVAACPSCGSDRSLRLPAPERLGRAAAVPVEAAGPAHRS